VDAPAGPPGARVARWIIADPAVEGFGQEIEAGLSSNQDRFLARDATGLALIDDETGWVAVENVQADDQKSCAGQGATLASSRSLRRRAGVG